MPRTITPPMTSSGPPACQPAWSSAIPSVGQAASRESDSSAAAARGPSERMNCAPSVVASASAGRARRTSCDPGGRYASRGGWPAGCGPSQGTSRASLSTSVVIETAFGRGPAVAGAPVASPSAGVAAAPCSCPSRTASGAGACGGVGFVAGRRRNTAATIVAARNPRPPRAGRSQRGRGGFGFDRPAGAVVSTSAIVAGASSAGGDSAGPEPGVIISRGSGSVPDTGGWPRQAAIASAASAAVGYRSAGLGAVR